LRIAYVPDRQFGPSSRAVTEVEAEDGVTDRIATRDSKAPHQLRGERWMPQPFDFQREKRQFLRGVEQPQITAEFEAIDDAWRWT
jgi:hypothetical protein